jgi:hypothetical protein
MVAAPARRYSSYPGWVGDFDLRDHVACHLDLLQKSHSPVLGWPGDWERNGSIREFASCYTSPDNLDDCGRKARAGIEAGSGLFECGGPVPEIPRPEWLSPAQAARRLGVKPARMRQLERTGRPSCWSTPLGRLFDEACVSVLAGLACAE